MNKRIIVDLDPPITVCIKPKQTTSPKSYVLITATGTDTHRRNASVKDLTTTQARTKRSKVMPGGGPPGVGAEALTSEFVSMVRRGGKVGGLTIFALDEVEQLGVEGVAKLGHGLRELGSVNGAGVVSVKMFEDAVNCVSLDNALCRVQRV